MDNINEFETKCQDISKKFEKASQQITNLNNQIKNLESTNLNLIDKNKEQELRYKELSDTIENQKLEDKTFLKDLESEYQSKLFELSENIDNTVKDKVEE